MRRLEEENGHGPKRFAMNGDQILSLSLLLMKLESILHLDSSPS